MTKDDKAEMADFKIEVQLYLWSFFEFVHLVYFGHFWKNFVFIASRIANSFSLATCVCHLCLPFWFFNPLNLATFLVTASLCQF